MVVHLERAHVCLFAEGGEVHAVDNRCPHMGFPLHRGSVSDGILTCHWHHARFDLCTGGTFDQWADELRRFPVEVEGDDIYVDLTPPADPVEHQRQRLYVGLGGTSRWSREVGDRAGRSRPERSRRVPRGSSSASCGAAGAGSAA